MPDDKALTPGTLTSLMNAIRRYGVDSHGATLAFNAHVDALEADRKAMWDALALLERADHQHYASDAEAILQAALAQEKPK